MSNIFNSIKRIINQYKCAHQFRFVGKLYGSDGTPISEWHCDKCGKTEYRDWEYCDEKQPLRQILYDLYQQFHNDEYAQWKISHKESLDRVVECLRQSANYGLTSYDIAMTFDKTSNDFKFFEKWLNENCLLFDASLISNVENTMLTYKYHISWVF